MMGPGKYDPQLTEALKACKATQGILIVVDGFAGQSFCAQLTAENAIKIPKVLRQLAEQIEQSWKEGEG